MSVSHSPEDASGALEDVEARFAIVAGRVERPLTDEQAAEVRTRIARSIALSVTLRSLPLANGDAPGIDLITPKGDGR